MTDDEILTKWYTIKQQIQKLEEEEKKVKRIICETMYTRNTDKIYGSEYICVHNNPTISVISPTSRISIYKRYND